MGRGKVCEEKCYQEEQRLKEGHSPPPDKGAVPGYPALERGA